MQTRTAGGDRITASIGRLTAADGSVADTNRSRSPAAAGQLFIGSDRRPLVNILITCENTRIHCVKMTSRLMISSIDGNAWRSRMLHSNRRRIHYESAAEKQPR